MVFGIAFLLTQNVLLMLVRFQTREIGFNHLVNVPNRSVLSFLGSEKADAFTVHLTHAVEYLVAVIIHLRQRHLRKEDMLPFIASSVKFSNPVRPLSLITWLARNIAFCLMKNV
jgi:hypothetical protein